MLALCSCNYSTPLLDMASAGREVHSLINAHTETEVATVTEEVPVTTSAAAAGSEPTAFVEPCSPEPADQVKVDPSSSVPFYDLEQRKLVVNQRPSMEAVGAAMQALLGEAPGGLEHETTGAADEKHAEIAAAAAAAAALESVDPIGPWFDSSPHDAKTTVKEIGTILRAFEDSLWNHGGDFNAIESAHLWKVIVHMRTVLTDLEMLILQPRFARNQWMPSLALTNGMKQCFDRLAARRDLLVRSKLDESRKAAIIIDEAGKLIGKMMGEAMALTAKAVGIDYFKEIAAEEAATGASRGASTAKPVGKQTPAAPTRARRNRRKKKS
jgi:hypothetical protein